MDHLTPAVELVADVLGPELIGSYLHGSAVLGGLRPASDVDLLVVSRRSLTPDRRRALLDGLLKISGLDAPLRPVELVVVVQSAVRPWTYPPVCDFLYGEWLRTAYEQGEVPQPAELPDLAVLLTMALAGDRTLSGPPLASVLDPVPWADVVAASTAGVPGLLADLDTDTRNVLLTLARVWTTVATGRIRSKDEAARWALERLPEEHRDVLAHARELYLGARYEEERWSPELRARVLPCAEEMAARIEAARVEAARAV
ncbi:aminoglycoside adenylyltransferase family protein [Streptomyces indicus]|uniref:Streptomycin 3-adenylyltransferase n=1 Tax=Streptomyces indicus TaxID=417292 RepID=A0A1G9FGB9_9ACTN|nr:aminoglycoside adenylyltransferase family protein [Streptomyces indicus]SDK87386.1 streptomycin 3-adenylyltransferase [Streptomyces indicus]